MIIYHAYNLLNISGCVKILNLYIINDKMKLHTNIKDIIEHIFQNVHDLFHYYHNISL